MRLVKVLLTQPFGVHPRGNIVEVTPGQANSLCELYRVGELVEDDSVDIDPPKAKRKYVRRNKPPVEVDE